MNGTIQIGGHEITVIVKESIIDEGGNTLCGIYREREGVILISKQAGAMMAETLIHEVMHAVDTIYNNGKLDEDTIDALSQGWLQILKGGDVFKALSGQEIEDWAGDE